MVCEDLECLLKLTGEFINIWHWKSHLPKGNILSQSLLTRARAESFTEKNFTLIIFFIWESLAKKLEKAMATHSSTLAWKIPWTEEPGGRLSMGSHSWTGLKWLSSSSSKEAETWRGCDLSRVEELRRGRERTGIQLFGLLISILSGTQSYFKMQRFSYQTFPFPNEELINDAGKLFRFVGRTFLPNSHPNHSIYTVVIESQLPGWQCLLQIINISTCLLTAPVKSTWCHCYNSVNDRYK